MSNVLLIYLLLLPTSGYHVSPLNVTSAFFSCLSFLPNEKGVQSTD